MLCFYGVIMLSLQEDTRQRKGKHIKRFLLRILPEGGFITAQQRERVQDRQKEKNVRIGEILMEMGMLDNLELNAVLSIQKDLASYKDAVKIAAGVRPLLGRLLLKARRITDEQIDCALREQHGTGRKFGQVLVHLGMLTGYELDAVLEFQRHLEGEAPLSEKLKLGQILISTGQITGEQLEDALERQRLSRKKIGELLIDAWYGEPYQVEHGLNLQRKLVTASLAAALSLSHITLVRDASAGAARGVTAKITVMATVLEHTSLNVISQTKELVVTNNDIQQGYVDVPLASRVNVKTNNAAGYLLVFEVMDGPYGLFRGINVRLGGREFQLPLQGGWILQPFVPGGTMLDISYRFVLSENAQPGTYSWPIMVSAGRL